MLSTVYKKVMRLQSMKGMETGSVPIIFKDDEQ